MTEIAKVTWSCFHHAPLPQYYYLTRYQVSVVQFVYFLLLLLCSKLLLVESQAAMTNERHKLHSLANARQSSNSLFNELLIRRELFIKEGRGLSAVFQYFNYTERPYQNYRIVMS